MKEERLKQIEEQITDLLEKVDCLKKEAYTIQNEARDKAIKECLNDASVEVFKESYEHNTYFVETDNYKLTIYLSNFKE